MHQNCCSSCSCSFYRCRRHQCRCYCFCCCCFEFDYTTRVIILPFVNKIDEGLSHISHKQASFPYWWRKRCRPFSVYGSWVWTRLKQIKRIKSSGWRSKSSASQSAAAAAAVDVGGQRIGRKRGGIDWKNYEPKFVEFSKGRIRQEVSLFFTFPPNLALILFSSAAMPFLPPRRKKHWYVSSSLDL